MVAHYIFSSLHLLVFNFFKMASQLNSYCNFINIGNKEGQSLVANAIDKIISPLSGDERISLVAKDYQKLKDNLNRLRSR